MADCVFDLEFDSSGLIPLNAYAGHNVTLTEHIQQMDKYQDQTYIGDGIDEITGELFHYGMVTDGHGADGCISTLRNITKYALSKMIGKKNPVQTFADYVNSFCGAFDGGATMCLAKIYKNKIECINCGDSQLAVYKDNELIYLSTLHNWENANDRKRLLAFNPKIKFEPSANIKVLTSSLLVGTYMEYAVWPNKSKLACTQALGGCGKTGYAPDHHIIPIEKGSTYKIVIGSDGVWDVVNKENPEELAQFASMNGKEIIDFVHGRWLQEWDMITLDEPNKCRKGQFEVKQCDDMSVVVIDITPK